MALVCSFSKRLLLGGRASRGQDRLTRAPSYYGAHLTFLPASRPLHKPPPTPRNLWWPVNGPWVQKVRNAPCFHWFIGSILTPSFCLKHLSFLRSSNKLSRSGHKGVGNRLSTEFLVFTSSSGSLQIQCRLPLKTDLKSLSALGLFFFVFALEEAVRFIALGVSCAEEGNFLGRLV